MKSNTLDGFAICKFAVCPLMLRFKYPVSLVCSHTWISSGGKESLEERATLFTRRHCCSPREWSQGLFLHCVNSLVTVPEMILSVFRGKVSRCGQ